MGVDKIKGTEDITMQKVLCLLGALRHSDAGRMIYDQVERQLHDIVDSQHIIESTYASLVHHLLDAQSLSLQDDEPKQVQVRLLQACLQPPITQADLKSLQAYVDQHSGDIESALQLDSVLFQEAIGPLLSSFGISSQSEVQPAVASPVEEHGELDAEDNVDFTSLPDTPLEEDPGSTLEQDSTDNKAEENEPSSDTYSAKRKDIEKIQRTLDEQVSDSISQNEEFGVLLEVVLGELRQAVDSKELEELRWTLIREIEKLTHGHHDLADKLDSTHHYLKLIESDSRQLSDELTRVRLLSMTDELTGLPNRRAFLRRIEDEVARVQRYGFPLSLSLIDLDHFKQVNDQYGHNGGDEILQLYSKAILSIFRHHDLVCRYGGEEFAVLLPNTDLEGSTRALNKVRNRAAETHWKPTGESIRVPTFSAGIALYKPGETASSFVERADRALYKAQRRRA